MAEVHRARRPAARVQAERPALLVLVEDPVQVPVGEVEATLQEGMELAGVLVDPPQEGLVDLLRAKLLDEAVVIDVAPHLPRGDDEVLGH